MKKNKGFTLFELLVSISIIAILVALATASFSGAQKKARDSRRKEDLSSVQKAAEQYYALNGGAGYPTANWTYNSAWTVAGTTVLQSFPKDPQSSKSYNISTSTATNYCMCAQMEETDSGNSSTNACNFTAASKAYYCISNQQ